jgi:hypothetical protein
MISKKNGTILKKRQKKFSRTRQEQGKTGGGPRPKPISQAMEIIIDLYNTVIKCYDVEMMYLYDFSVFHRKNIKQEKSATGGCV